MGLLSTLLRKFRKQEIKGPFELSVEELYEKSLAPKDSEGRKVLLSVKQDEFRLIPKCMLETAKKHLEQTNDIEKVLRYIVNGFYIYRETACHNWQAPFYKVEDAYEWPAPVKFSWTSIDAVILGGESVQGPIPTDGKVRITVEENGKIKETTIDIKEDGAVKQTTIRDLIPGKEDLKSKLKYRIDDLSLVGLVNMQAWQTVSLKSFANPMYHMIVAFKKELPEETAREYLDQHLENLSQTCLAYVGVYSKKPHNVDVLF